MFRSIKQWCIGALSTVFVVGAFDSFAQVDGGALFKAKCATCHSPHKDGTGPKLFKVREKWAAEGAKEGSIYTWVANWNAAAAADPYAKKVSGLKPTAMNTFPDLAGKTEDIDAIFNWIDEQPDPSQPKEGDVAAGPGASDEVEEDGLSWVWILMGVVFIVIIMAVGGVRRQLRNATREQEVQALCWDRRISDHTFTDCFLVPFTLFNRCIGRLPTISTDRIPA